MNEVSIIINGVRYDAEFKDSIGRSCRDCELHTLCDDGDYYNQSICEKLGLDSLIIIFKKSTKSFER